MMRSFFDSQKGDFSLELHGIAAYKGDAKLDRSAASDQYQHEHQHRHHGRAVEYESEDDEDPKAGVLAAKELPPRQARRSWWRGMACGLL
ncbi:hypothetical protein HIM_05964 [Hirsutella minnesotensis 3608]|uniref:Uncharacterized protein n=1 Tax=Hirsutella minnesotensis 3608 TaxID=1043627 RepID=A0A0F8A530_9HYPO|nr:hypothetical protein HIM_05964 [Hirsutella minnesotensis 3608]